MTCIKSGKEPVLMSDGLYQAYGPKRTVGAVRTGRCSCCGTPLELRHRILVREARVDELEELLREIEYSDSGLDGRIRGLIRDALENDRDDA